VLQLLNYALGELASPLGNDPSAPAILRGGAHPPPPLGDQPLLGPQELVLPNQHPPGDASSQEAQQEPQEQPPRKRSRFSYSQKRLIAPQTVCLLPQYHDEYPGHEGKIARGSIIECPRKSNGNVFRIRWATDPGILPSHIRQYFPKNTDFRTLTHEDIKTVMDKLNNRPRKSLDFKTPNQVFFNDNPFVPIHWGKNQKGMQAYEEFIGDDADYLTEMWLKAKDNAVHYANELIEIGVHKQIVNQFLCKSFMQDPFLKTVQGYF